MGTLHRQRKAPHVLVRIKNELELSQAEIPDAFGITLDTFKNIVHGRQKAWDKHARIISDKTGVAFKCLVANNARKPLLAVAGKKWTANDFALPIAARHLSELERNLSRGRHTLQWFRIVMIKVARCMLAAYKDKRPGVAFGKLLRSIKDVGESCPSYTAKVPFKPKPGEPLRFQILPPDNEKDTVCKQAPVKEVCPLEDWDFDLQSAVATIPSRSRQGIELIFGRFVKSVLKQERFQNKAAENDLTVAAQQVQKLRAKPSLRK